MPRHFILYVNDNSVKVYHAIKNSIAFYNKYDLEDTKALVNLISLLDKHYSWKISLYLETSEVMIEKKVFTKKNAKDVKAIISNYIHKPGYLFTCGIPNNQYEATAKKNQNDTEYVILSVPESASLGLKNLITFVSESKNKIELINFLPIGLGLSNIVKNEYNTINTVMRVRKDHTYAIDVFYGFSFILHREDILDEKTTLKQELMNTIGYAETLVTNTSITFITTIMTEIIFSKEEISGIKSDKLNIIHGNDIVSSFGAKAKLKKNSESQIDDGILAVIFIGKHKHPSFVNILLNKKKLFFKSLPISYGVIGLLVAILLATEVTNIFIKLPEKIKKIAAAEEQADKLRKQLNELKKVTINEETLSYIKACAALENIDLQKTNYGYLAETMNKAIGQYSDKLLFTKYSFTCSQNCYGSNANIKFFISGELFNRDGEYESMISMINKINNNIQKSFPLYLVLPNNSQISIQLGVKYYKVPFELALSK